MSATSPGLKPQPDDATAQADPRGGDAADRTSETFAVLGRVAGGLAHELNNLLQPIIGLAQLELDSLPGDGSPAQVESRESLAMILESGHQARNVVRQILTFAGKAKPKLAATDLSAAVSRAAASCARSLAPGVGVDLVIDPGAAGFAAINEAELIEIIANLAANSADAMGGNGTLTLHVERLELTNAAGTLGIPAGCYFRISVADNGHGMDAATREKIFEPFFSTKPPGQGTGLGLSMVHGVLRDWKGAIAVESSVGVGSTFSLYIPVTAIN